MQFVLRLRPDVHRELKMVPEGIIARSAVANPALWAYSTYFHEMIHWWQHSGSTLGLILSLSHPAQTHMNHRAMCQFIQAFGPQKSIRAFDERLVPSNYADAEAVANTHRIVNNFQDIEFARRWIVDPATAREFVRDPYFESVGHSLDIAWSGVNWLLSSIVDDGSAILPDVAGWETEFDRLRRQEAHGFYYGSPVGIPPLGAREIFEAQARFSQLQLLGGGADGRLTIDECSNRRMLDGVYGAAFKTFLALTNSHPPKYIHDPLVGLFLLVCDIALNPAEGFPFDISSFSSFIENVDPGMRFHRACGAIANRSPDLKGLIVDYSHAEYIQASATICTALGERTPVQITDYICGWADASDAIKKLLCEEKDFGFADANLPVRVLLARFICFQLDKQHAPEFFCWPGIWASGERADDRGRRLLNANAALFLDGEDGDVYPREWPGKSPEHVQRTFDRFYAWNVVYDLGRQWVLREGPFDLRYTSLTSKYRTSEIVEWAAHHFANSFGVDPRHFNVVPT
jgi:hypothetical protein